MADLTYISTNVQDGLTFDDLVGNLLSYRVEQWGFTEQDYTQIASQFGVGSNDLYYLPAGNYRLTNVPNSVLGDTSGNAYSSVNLYVFEDGATKKMIYTLGTKERFYAEKTSAGSSTTWEDITNTGGDGADLVLLEVGVSAPSDTNKLWVDTSKLSGDEVSLKYYDGSKWVSYTVNGVMLQTVYDTKGLKKDPYEAVLEALQEFIGDYTNFLRHKANELTLIHLVSDERDYYENYMVTSEKLAEIFAVWGDLYNEMSEFITSKTAEITKIDTNEEAVTAMQTEYDEHTATTEITRDNVVLSSDFPLMDMCYGKDKFVATVSNSTIVAYSSDGITWNESTISSTSRDWFCVCYGNDKFVVIAENSNIFAYSSNGITWTESTISSTSRYWESVCYGKDKFVAITDSNIFAYSLDGITWTEITISDTSRSWYSVCYGNGKFVAVAYASNYFAYSSDGITWNEGTISSTSRYWNSVCYGNDKFVAVAFDSNYYAYSSDGIDWTEINLKVDNVECDLIYITYGDGLFIADGSAGIAASSDGITWKWVYMWNDLWGGPMCYHNNTFYVLYSTENEKIYYMTISMPEHSHVSAAQVSSWENKSEKNHTHILDEGVTISGSNITSPDGDIFPIERVSPEAKERAYKLEDLSVLDSPSPEDLKDKYHNGNLLYTEDSTGNTEWWKITDNSKFGSIVFIESIMPSNSSWSAVCYGKDKFVAVVDSGYGYAYSLDGINWTSGTIVSAYSHWNSVCYGNDKFVAVIGNKYAYSYDGIDWTEGTVGSTISGLKSVCYGNDKFIAVSRGVYNSETYEWAGTNYFAYSSDGITWNEGTISNTSRTWYSVCYGNDKFVAVANGTNYFAYSSDGINWTEGTISDTSRGWQSVCYGKDKFVVSSTFSNMAYSLDGITWTETFGGTAYAGSVCYGNGKFVAVAGVTFQSNYFSYSFDGINWAQGVLDSSRSRRGIICYGNGKFVVVEPTARGYTSYGIPGYTQGIKLFSSNISELPFENLENLPTTIEGYGITDMASSTDVENLSSTVKTDLYYQHTPISGELAMSNFNTATDTIYVGIQKSLNTTGGGTTNYPMSTEHSKLDLIVYGSQAADTTHVNVSKMNCETVHGNSNLKWNESTISSTNRNWIYVCYGNGKFVAVCQRNIFAYSSDGITWTESTISDTSRGWNLVCYGKDKFVAVCQSNIFAYSSDGITWTESTISDTSRQWIYVCYGNGKFVAVAYGSTYYAYSSDGITWNESTISSTSRQWRSVCYGNDKFVAVAYNSNYFAYSLDGITWTERMISSSRLWQSVCYGKDKFIAVGYSSNYFAYSSDGISWTESTMPNSRNRNSVCYGNDKFVAVAQQTNYFDYSLDGINWTESTISNTSRMWQSVCYGKDKFVAVAYDTNYFAYAFGSLSTPTSDVGFSEISTEIPYTNYFNTLYSTDESNPRWASDGLGAMVSCPLSTTEQQLLRGTYTIGENTYDVDVSYKNGTGVIFNVRIDKAIKSMQSMCDVMNENQMVAYGLLEKHAKTVAENTQIPVAIEYNMPSSQRWSSVCYGKDRFVAVTSANIFAYSYDSINWIEGEIIESTDDFGILCYGNDKFVAITWRSPSRYCAYSLDGITWTIGTIGTTPNGWYSVCYGNDKFVAVAYESNIFAYSSDGITWNEGTISDTSRNWTSVCYGNDKFVAITNTNIFAYSLDGITWNESTISTSRYWGSVCYGNDKFVAVAGSSNYFAYSSDGITWSESTISSTSRTWQSVCYGNDKFVAITYNSNYFAYSLDGITWNEGTISDTSRTWRSVCYGKDKFVAIARNDKKVASIYT